MKKVLTAILTAAGSAIGAAAVPLYFRWRIRRNAEATRPKIEALLDEMISLIASNASRLERVVFRNEVTTVNDDHRDRDLSIQVGGDYYSLDVTIKLVGRKAGRVTVGFHRHRGDQRLHLYWPDCMEYWPMEPWLKERLDRLDRLVGTASRRDRVDRILSRFDGGKDDDGTPNTN
ncbi:MAG TPA: hypothetical protein VL283_03690 [Candidatus Baltobacteraceae bacterium]|nr:hypothetical protein [Candidatus Baltobacteraceae bacterium]